MNDSIPALEQFIEPSPVRFTWEAPGWHIIVFATILILLFSVILFLHNYHKNKYRRLAIKQLQKTTNDFIGQKQYAEIIYAANMTMKQICMKLYSRETCADLRAKDWLDFLNQTAKKKLFQDKDEELLLSLYLPETQLSEKDTMVFVDKVNQWIKKHKHALVRRK